MVWVKRVLTATVVAVCGLALSVTTSFADECEPIGTITATFDVEEPTGTLEILKFRQNEDGSLNMDVPLVGAIFYAFDAIEEEPFGALYPDGAGKYTLEELPPGDYIIEETPPEGHGCTQCVFTVTVKANEIATFLVGNVPQPVFRAEPVPAAIQGPTFRPLAVDPLTITLDPALTPGTASISPRPEGLPDPVTTGNTITWDLSTLTAGSYHISIEATSATPGTYPITLAGTAAGTPINVATNLTTTTPSTCAPTAPPTTARPTPTTTPTSSVTPTGTGTATSTSETTTQEPHSELAATGSDALPQILAGLLLATAGTLLLRRKRSHR